MTIRSWTGLARCVGAWCTLSCLSGQAFAAPTAAFAPEPPVKKAAYVPPPPIRIQRFYVYAKLKQRIRSRATIESFVSTSERPVVVADHAVIERETAHPEGPEWTAVASATVKKILPNGRLEVELDPAPNAPKQAHQPSLAAGQKIRLRIDRRLPPE